MTKSGNSELRFEDIPQLVSELSRKIQDLQTKLDAVARPAPEVPMGINACAEWLSEVEGREVTTTALYNRVSRQQIPYHKDGARLMFFRSEIIEQCKAGGNDTLDRQAEEHLQRVV